jgi:hypothetical protein
MTGAARRAPDPRTLLRPNDPNHHLLHRSLRIAVVFPALVAFGLYVLHEPQFTLIAAFGAFGTLGLVDLGGGVRQRARAHLVITGLGVVLVAVASVASPWIAVAAAVMFVGAFALQLSAVFGGFFSAGEPALLLPFVIAVMVALPNPPAGRCCGRGRLGPRRSSPRQPSPGGGPNPRPGRSVTHWPAPPGPSPAC